MHAEYALSYSGTDSWARIPLGGAGRDGRFFAGISLARAGDMGLAAPGGAARRGELARSLGRPGAAVYAVRQVHSRRVISVDAKSPAECLEAEADGMTRGRPGGLLTVTVADCLPIFIADPRSGAYAVVHSGWKGTGIAAAAIGVMRASYGASPRDLAVTIGPGIGACCYAVPGDRWEAFRAEFGPAAAVGGGEAGFSLDLRRANIDLLRKAGVDDVAVVTDCTSCSPALGSFRRQGPEAFTRMLAFISEGEA